MPNALAPLLQAIAALFDCHPAAAAARHVIACIAQAQTAAMRHPPRTTALIDALLPGMLSHQPSQFTRTLSQTNHLVSWSPPLTDRIPESMTRQMAYCELVGPDGTLESDSCRLGLYAQGPHTPYEWHSHAAEELYIAVSGTAGWQMQGQPEQDRPPVAHIHHPSWRSHAMRTRNEPLLAIWAWVGDLSLDTYRMDV